MSAFVVSKSHIDALIAAGLTGSYPLSWYHEGEHHQLKHDNASNVGAMLWAENVRSVEHRYSPPGREAIYGEGWETPNAPLPGSYTRVEIVPEVQPIEMPEWVGGYMFKRPQRAYQGVEILKAIACYEYQSCEHDEWETSEAKTFCKALRSRMIQSLPGYDTAAWEIDS